jgi:CubicO group peptidase (beta-lactamase class C family)
MKERIFEPLGMEDTAFNVPPDKVHRYAAMYSTNAEKEIVAVPQTPEVQPKFLMGGGGLYGTTADYLAFCQMMLNKGELNSTRLLSRKTVELMTRNHLGDIPTMGHGLSEVPSTRPGHGFGLGYAVITDGAQAGGLISDGSYYWGGAAHTRFWIDPQEEFIGIFMVHIFNPQQDYQGQFRVLGYQAISD